MSEQHLVNPELQAMAIAAVAELQKQAKSSWLPKSAFVGAGDPAMMGGDPAAAGGAPPMDPAMMGGAPPGGAPPMDPAMAGAAAPPMDGGGGDIRSIIKEELAAAGIGGGGGGGGIKPKIDVNVELMQIKKLLARMADAMGINIPASDMVATPGDLTEMANQEQQVPPAGGDQPSAIQPIEPVQGAMPEKGAHENGRAFDGAGMEVMGNRAAAIARIRGVH